MPTTVLSHLALKLSTHPENLATEALGYILSSSPEARSALATIVQLIGFVPSSNIIYKTQRSMKNGTRPDLIGVTTAGIAEIYVEAKFWAGLTAAQPVLYLNNLPPGGGLLLFVAPALRIENIWVELIHRCTNAGLGIGQISNNNELRYVKAANHYLALISWRRLLDSMAVSLKNAGDLLHAADVQQLNGLCEEMDSNAFLPLHSEELTGSLGKRVFQFWELTDDLVTLLVNNSLIPNRGNSSKSNGYYGRNLLFKGFNSFFGFDAWKWDELGQSPLWLQTHHFDIITAEDLLQLFEDNNIKAYIAYNGWFCIPVYLKIGLERDSIIADCLDQLTNIANILPH